MMHDLLDFPAGPVGRALALLFHASIEGAVAVVIVVAASLLLARRAPALRCRLWWVACCKLLVGLAGIAPLALPILPAAESPASTVLTPFLAPSGSWAADVASGARFPWHAVVAALSPTILLPGSRTPSLSEDDLAMALCHELVHVRRHDLGLGWVPSIAARVFFFHPGAVIAAREYALAREEACDAEVLRILGVSPRRYGRLLLEMSAAAPRTLAPAVGVSSSFLHLRRRLRMLEHALDRNGHATVRWVVVALLAAAILIPVRLAARSPHDSEEAAAPPPQRGERPVAGLESVPSSGDAYVLFQDDSSVTMSGSMDDLARARGLRERRGEKILWFRRNGNEYVVSDPSVLRSVLDVHDTDHGKEAEEKQEQMDAEQAELEARLEALSARKDELEDRRPETEDSAADLYRKVLEETRRQQQAEMDHQIDKVSSRIDSLSAEQEEIGRELERVSMEADRRIRALLEKSVTSGAARRVRPPI